MGNDTLLHLDEELFALQTLPDEAKISADTSLELDIFVSSTGRWIVAEWPEETEQNQHILETLHLEEDDCADTVSINEFNVGRHRVKVIFHEEEGPYEAPQDGDFWTTFEKIESKESNRHAI